MKKYIILIVCILLFSLFIDNRKVEKAGVFYSETQSARIKVQTIYHEGRKYDVFLNSLNSTGTPFVIRVK